MLPILPPTRKRRPSPQPAASPAFTAEIKTIMSNGPCLRARGTFLRSAGVREAAAEHTGTRGTDEQAGGRDTRHRTSDDEGRGVQGGGRAEDRVPGGER